MSLSTMRSGLRLLRFLGHPAGATTVSHLGLGALTLLGPVSLPVRDAPMVHGAFLLRAPPIAPLPSALHGCRAQFATAAEPALDVCAGGALAVQAVVAAAGVATLVPAEGHAPPRVCKEDTNTHSDADELSRLHAEAYWRACLAHEGEFAPPVPGQPLLRATALGGGLLPVFGGKGGPLDELMKDALSGVPHLVAQAAAAAAAEPVHIVSRVSHDAVHGTVTEAYRRLWLLRAGDGSDDSKFAPLFALNAADEGHVQRLLKRPGGRLAERLGAIRRVAVVGPPGTGKSVWLNQLVMWGARAGLTVVAHVKGRDAYVCKPDKTVRHVPAVVGTDWRKTIPELESPDTLYLFDPAETKKSPAAGTPCASPYIVDAFTVVAAPPDPAHVASICEKYKTLDYLELHTYAWTRAELEPALPLMGIRFNAEIEDVWARGEIRAHAKGLDGTRERACKYLARKGSVREALESAPSFEASDARDALFTREPLDDEAKLFSWWWRVRDMGSAVAARVADHGYGAELARLGRGSFM